MTDLVLVEKDGPVATLWLNRPDKRNALNIPMLEALCAAVDDASADDAIRVIVLRGKGTAFCSGLDLKEAQDPEVSHSSAKLIARMLESIYYSPKVTLAVVQGAAVAGGAGLMSACDVALGAVDAKYGYPEVHRGLVAGLVMTFLRRQLHERHARELLLLGEIIEGERAQEIGLLTRCVPGDMLDEAAELLIENALKGGPQAIKLTKEFFDRLYHRSVREDLQRALDLHVAVRTGGEAQEGMRAFTEKRAPGWQV
jgi:methylglutaconyl-CoA hydratase